MPDWEVGSSFADCELDAQGRVLITQGLRQAVNLQCEISFVGVIDYVELWDQSAYDPERRRAASDMDQLVSYINDKYCGIV